MHEVLFILLAVASSCGLIGSVLVVRNQSLLADALSHSVLLGIVLGFFISHSLDSPLLMLGATLFGVVTVLAIEGFHTRKLAHDAATGLLFTFFFSLAVLLISLFARNVHLDMDMVLMGEVLFAPLHRMEFFGWSLPVALGKSLLILGVNLLFFVLCYHSLVLYLFDKNHASLQGLATRWLEIVLLFLVSLTTVLSFESVGSMTVIVFLVAPAMTALPWVATFWQLLLVGQLLAAAIVCLGYSLATTFDLTMSGTCSVVALVLFLLSHFVNGRVKS